MKRLFALILILTVFGAAIADDNYATAVELIKKKNYQAAKVLLQSETKTNPQSVKACFALGYCHEQLGETTEAANYYKQAIAANFATGKDPGDAEKAMQRLHAVAPDVLLLLDHAGKLEKAAGQARADATKDLLKETAAYFRKQALGALPAKPKKPGQPENAPRQLTEAELEKNLGYNLGWAPRDAVEGPNGHKYKYFAEKVTWEEARKRCEKAGGFLVTITTEEENRFVCEMIKVPAWSGVDAKSKDYRTWKWITGESMSFNSWYEPQPEGPRHVAINPSNNKITGYKWGYSTRRWGYICEWVK